MQTEVVPRLQMTAQWVKRHMWGFSVYTLSQFLPHHKFIITFLKGEMMQLDGLMPPPVHYIKRNTVFESVKQGGSISVYPCRACDRCSEGIMIDLPSHNSPRSIINKLLKTYRGTEEQRNSRLCSPFVTVAFTHCNTVTRSKSSESV